jgi:hypothetical protein
VTSATAVTGLPHRREAWHGCWGTLITVRDRALPDAGEIDEIRLGIDVVGVRPHEYVRFETGVETVLVFDGTTSSSRRILMKADGGDLLMYPEETRPFHRVPDACR